MKSVSLPLFLSLPLLSLLSIAAVLASLRTRVAHLHDASPRTAMRHRPAPPPGPFRQTGAPRLPQTDIAAQHAGVPDAATRVAAVPPSTTAPTPRPTLTTVHAIRTQLRHRDVRATTIAAALTYMERYWTHAGHLPRHAAVNIVSGKLDATGGDPYIGLVMHERTHDRRVFLVRARQHGLLLADARGRMLQMIDLNAPLRHTRISSGWGWRKQPVLGWREFHKGIDYAAPIGTPVRAAMAGTVDMARWHGNYGKLVEIRHGDHLVTRYGHLSRFARGLHNGSHVRRGQVIGYVGVTGLATGPHLYFELWRRGRRIDPLRTALVRIRPSTPLHERLLAWVRSHHPQHPAPMLAAP
ncbi:M23 family metallopeptidase [Oleiagrimonas soli]|uniref:Murein DD-endopeptidase MepM/ murein hydrolase activator NlpD n=1 Tax=Oleiagrimonas soli TaxID=1543381 RepID=A0A841KHJ3_9GAMM|nr:M23 family metallopeptidase [Oleiagrimonas soli]MBB6184622.1 murein DD-endopeptidase MepM/ murein hydrolase activator NlpD [Oleiagrimonas soli]